MAKKPKKRRVTGGVDTHKDTHHAAVVLMNGRRLAESFFAALKNERVHRTQYPTREHACRDVARYIEFGYNSRRRHSGLDYRTPQQVHDAYLSRQLAA